MSEPRSKLSRVRQALHQTLAEGLGNEEAGRRVKVFDFPIAAVSGPGVVLAPALGGDWLELDPEEGTFCTHRLNMTLLMIGGKPMQKDSWLLLESWADQLQTVLLAAVDNELWDDTDSPPIVESIGGPQNYEFAGTTVLAVLADISIAIHK